MPEDTSVNSQAEFNHLRNEKSPYLLQHAGNPVDWYPWGEEAFELARILDKPIFLSIGYSTCHWCHVMEHESFEDTEVAGRMNELFVSIKVDREERPDIDNIYMTVCQMLSGSGGWPLTIIMTPDQKPFFAGTYLPKHSVPGRLGMLDLMERIGDYWHNKRAEIDRSAQAIIAKLQESTVTSAAPMPNKNTLQEAYSQFAGSFDYTNGGFGQAPKFPSAHNLMFLLRWWKRAGDSEALGMVEKTLTEMRRGGMYDQIGYGFHRYSTDARWFLPHFEKMLYDQAMLAIVYIEAFQATARDIYKDTALEIFEYVKRDMTSPEGGFYSAEDADSEGEEGKFYLLSKADLSGILSEDELGFALTVFNASAAGNYAQEASGQKTGANILHLRQSYTELAEKFKMSEGNFYARLETVREKIFEAREKRIHPHKDDKILTDWNGLMIAALALGGRVFEDSTLTDMARNALQFINAKMSQPDGSLLHRYREGEAAQPGFVDDYAFIIWGLLELYQTTFEVDFLKQALTYNDYLIEHFWDDKSGGFYFTADNGEQLINRQKEIYDGAIPSGNSIAALNLIKLTRITANPEYEDLAAQIGAAFSGTVNRYPAGYAMFLNAVDFLIGPAHEIVIAGDLEKDDTRDMLKALHQRFIPNKVLVFRPEDEDQPEIVTYAPYTKEQKAQKGRATAYVCQNYACNLPTNDIAIMLSLVNNRKWCNL